MTKFSKGIVSWFNEPKGFGFITNGLGHDVYVHFSEILCDGFKTLQKGDHVKFIEINSEIAPKATNVEIIKKDQTF